MFGQTPTASPPTSPTATATVTPTATVSATPDDEDDIAQTVRRAVKRHTGHVSIGSHRDIDLEDGEQAAGIAVAIVAVVFTTLFGAPVLIVAAIMFFSYLKNRALHRTVREMVAKGQPVPPELFAAPGTPAKARSDLRRGVILTSIGAGLIFFLAGVNGGFGGGEWAVGVIPLMIGAGYLLVWKLEASKRDNSTPVP